MNIIFVRHGESEDNAGVIKGEDTILTKRGKEQAKALGNRLKKYNIATIYTSRLRRAKQTGEIISKILKVPIKENLEELDEYPHKHLRSRLLFLFDIKLRKRIKRLKRFLDGISKEREEDKTILVIAHGITNKIIMSHLVQIPWRKQMLRFNQDNTGVNMLTWKKEYKNWSVRYINDIEHLPINLRNTPR
ncbi:MAG: histidine phosphatase family protein [Candidatus Nanoarchaeia archaeon]|nr:histidine phosphatase family protein [Candidatus Nanoarchaeia archaeon]